MDSETPAACVLRLVANGSTATLATRLGPEGWPYASLVLSATDGTGNPILLLSALAQHSKNLDRDPRLSLLYAKHDAGRVESFDYLAEARVTVLGHAARSDDAALRDHFLTRHPEATDYANFDDFAFYRVHIARAHLIQGFGRILWLEAADLATSGIGIG
jgi:putative heme iron utilization protein